MTTPPAASAHAELAASCGRIGTDPDALDAVYRACARDVERFVARRVRDPYDVADLAADVFVRAIGSAGGYDAARASPVAWLLGIASHVVAAHHEGTARRQHLERRVDQDRTPSGRASRSERGTSVRRSPRVGHRRGRRSSSPRRPGR